MEDKFFEADYSKEKKKFSIILDVFQDCGTLRIIPENGYQPTYQEIIGTLETHKITTIIRQSGANVMKAMKVFEADEERKELQRKEKDGKED